MHKLVLSMVVLTGCLVLTAQDVASVFVNMPRSKIMLLTDDNRKDMVDLFANGNRTKTTNLLGGESELKQLTADYLKLQLTTQNSVEIKLLPTANGDNVICIVYTACAPICDSRIEFYSLNWEPLPPQERLPMVRMEWFLNDTDKESEARKNALTALDTPFFRYELNAGNTDLTIANTTSGFLGLEERKQLKPYLNDAPMQLHWNGVAFGRE